MAKPLTTHSEPRGEHGSHPSSTPATALSPLGWPHVVVGRSRDRPLARMIVGTFGLVLGASTGLFLGGMLGVLLAMALLPFVPDIAVILLAVTTLTCTSAGAVLGARVLQRETFDELV